MSEKDAGPGPGPGWIKAEEKHEQQQKSKSAAPAVSSPTETLAAPNSSSSAAGAGDSRRFSRLLAGAVASPAGSPRVLAVPVDAVHVPLVAVPCLLAPASLLESPGFAVEHMLSDRVMQFLSTDRGQFAMTHQAVLATVTAQAQMQLQAAHSSSSEALAISLPQPASISPTPLQQRPSPVTDGNVSTPEPVQPPTSDQKSQSTQLVLKMSSSDGYNWRKYGQKQVKSSDRSRSYYKCTNVNCFAKKKVERCPDGRETEIIYRGQHNHDPPQRIKSPKEKTVQSGGPSGESETLDLPSGEVNESDPSTSKTEQNSGNETPERQLFCSSDCEGDAAIKTEEEHADEPEPKRRLNETHSITSYSAPVLKTIKEPRIVVQSSCDAARISDGYRWRKYGQKLVKGNLNPRSYYRCTHNGCPVRKHVERASDNAKAILITYEGKHNHEEPVLKTGSDQPATAHPIAAAAAATVTALVTKEEQSQTSDYVANKKLPTTTNGEVPSDKALELGGEKALESAETLLSIGFNSSSASGEAATGTNSDGVSRPLFSKKCAAVPAQSL